ncbi:dapper homolog 2 [Rhynchocyon petersi]
MQAPGAPGAGWDRRRVRLRLRAALAGLQELQVLREQQQARVQGALGARPPPPVSAAHDHRGQERRLQGALSALKEQLVRPAGSRGRRARLGLLRQLWGGLPGWARAREGGCSALSAPAGEFARPRGTWTAVPPVAPPAFQDVSDGLLLEPSFPTLSEARPRANPTLGPCVDAALTAWAPMARERGSWLRPRPSSHRVALARAPSRMRTRDQPLGQQPLRFRPSLGVTAQPLVPSLLRQQDSGLKTHLEKLDQRISQLQLGVCRGLGELLDSDSRPSSGFYELSDAASCSRSTSCASVCSEAVSPSSPCGQLPGGAQIPAPPAPRIAEHRPWSADETTVHMAPGGPLRPQLAEGAQRAWGDLERVELTQRSPQKSDIDVQSSSSLSCGDDSLRLDPKYQSDLVSQSGKQVYPYPSPLHAVALQSPLFILNKESPQVSCSESPQDPAPGCTGMSPVWTRPVPEDHLVGACIDKLLQRTQRRGSPLRDGVGEQGPLRCGLSTPQQKCGGQSMDQERCPEKVICSPKSRSEEGVTQSRVTHRGSPTHRGAMALVDTKQPAILPEVSTPSEIGVLGRTTWVPPVLEQGASPCPPTQQSFPLPQHGADSAHLSWMTAVTKAPSTVLGQVVPGLSAGASGSHRPRPKPGNLKVKATKVKRRTSDKMLKFPERQWGAPMVPWVSAEWGPFSGPQGDLVLRGRATLARDTPGRSCSETTLYPVPLLVPLVVAQRESPRASGQALYPLDTCPLSLLSRTWAKRKQCRWQSSVEISTRAHPTGLPAHLGLGPHRTPGKKEGCHQGRPLLPQPCLHPHSTSRLPEHSAPCSALSHKTIAETSEDEDTSGHTTDRFGDQESSDSAAEGSSGQSRGGPASGPRTARQGQPARPPPAAPQPSRASTGPRPPPAPRLYHIKASRALKKRLRSFQPQVLRVMTTV